MQNLNDKKYPCLIALLLIQPLAQSFLAFSFLSLAYATDYSGSPTGQESTYDTYKSRTYYGTGQSPPISSTPRYRTSSSTPKYSSTGLMPKSHPHTTSKHYSAP